MNGASGSGYQTGNMGETGDEPGAVENRLSLDPNDERWPAIADWEDGKEYTFTNVKVRQISAGEFEVTAAKAGASSDAAPDQAAADDGGEAAAESAPPPRKGKYSNPAIENLD